MSEANANPDTGAAAEATGTDPIAAFEKVLERRDKGSPASDKGAKSQPAAATEEKPEPKEEAKAEQDEKPEKPEGEPEEKAEPEESDEPRYKVKVDGKETEVPVSELVKGYQRETDYRNKTKEVAELRKEFDSGRQSVAQERQQLAQAVTYFASLLPQVAPPDSSLIETNPVEYLRQKQVYENVSMQRQQAAQAIQAISQRSALEEQKAKITRLASEQKALEDAKPEWKDAKVKAQELMDLRDFLSKKGMTEDEIEDLSVNGNHKVVLALLDGMRFNKTVAEARAASKKVAPLPRVETPGQRQVSPTDGRTSAMRTLRQRPASLDAQLAAWGQLIK